MSGNGAPDKETIYARVVEILDEVLNLQSKGTTVAPETRFIEDLGAESLDMAQFVMSLEDQFQKSIKDEELMGLKSVQDAVDYIHKRLAEPDE
ncbi:MAG: acyl carrier protein [Spirochaetales bacterium]|nr:acyl carrier protein [Spirochaetales bacterium]